MTKPALNYIKAVLMLHFVCMRVSLRDNERWGRRTGLLVSSRLPDFLK